MIHPPPAFSGTIDLVIELRLTDDTVVDRGSLHLEWLQGPTKTPNPIESATATAISENSAEKALAAAAPTDQNVLDYSGRSWTRAD